MELTLNKDDANAFSVIDSALQPGLRIDRAGYVEINKAIEYLANRLARLHELEQQEKRCSGEIAPQQ